MARTCNVATDRLGYQDVRGLSAPDPHPRPRIGVRTIHFYDSGPPRKPGLVNRPRLVCLGDQTGLTTPKVGSVSGNGVDVGSSLGEGRFKACRLYSVGLGLTPKWLQAGLPHNCLRPGRPGLPGTWKPSFNAMTIKSHNQCRVPDMTPASEHTVAKNRKA